MMTPCQRELIKVIGQILDVQPDYRLGQLITNLPFLVGQDATDAATTIEDDALLESARLHLEDLRARIALPEVSGVK
jgi:hypothetical protein